MLMHYKDILKANLFELDFLSSLGVFYRTYIHTRDINIVATVRIQFRIVRTNKYSLGFPTEILFDLNKRLIGYYL